MPQAGSGGMRASVTAGPPRHLLTSLLSRGFGDECRPAGPTAPLWMWPDWGPHGAATLGVIPGCVGSKPAPPAEPGLSHVGGHQAPGRASGGPASHTATPQQEACPDPRMGATASRKLVRVPGWVPQPAGPRDVTGHLGVEHGGGQSPQALPSTGTHLGGKEGGHLALGSLGWL